MSRKDWKPLNVEMKGKEVVIKQLNFSDYQIVHKLNNIGFVLGAKVKVLDFNNSKKVLHLQIFNIQYVLRVENCKNIYVEVI